MKNKKIGLWLCVGVWMVCCQVAFADWIFLPVNRHQQFLTYGLFTDEHTGIVYRDNNHAWAAIGDSLAIVENTDWLFKPQLVVSGNVDVSFLEKTWAFDFGTETFDARFSLEVEFSVTDNLRFWFGTEHLSGHGADSLQDPKLGPPNLGDDTVMVRVVYDIDHNWRVGAELNPEIDSDPPGQWFGAKQFAEWFPIGLDKNFTGGSPYLAVGLEEGGVNDVELTYHAQIGLLYGNHFAPEKKPAIRFVFGYYGGWDPRLKYAQFRNSKSYFLYGGLQIGL